jgi:hypothetical protein
MTADALVADRHPGGEPAPRWIRERGPVTHPARSGGLAMLGVVAAVLAVLVGVRQMMR